MVRQALRRGKTLHKSKTPERGKTLKKDKASGKEEALGTGKTSEKEKATSGKDKVMPGRERYL